MVFVGDNAFLEHSRILVLVSLHTFVPALLSRAQYFVWAVIIINPTLREFLVFLLSHNHCKDNGKLYSVLSPACPFPREESNQEVKLRDGFQPFQVR